jgi:hypothetical protein
LKLTPSNLPSNLTIHQWQSLLVAAIDLLQNTTNAEEDLAYTQWLIEQWRLDQQRIIHQQTILHKQNEQS